MSKTLRWPLPSTLSLPRPETWALPSAPPSASSNAIAEPLLPSFFPCPPAPDRALLPAQVSSPWRALHCQTSQYQCRPIQSSASGSQGRVQTHRTPYLPRALGPLGDEVLTPRLASALPRPHGSLACGPPPGPRFAASVSTLSLTPCSCRRLGPGPSPLPCPGLVSLSP